MGRGIRFRGAIATPKTLEKGLLEKSKALAENPHIMMPKCTRDCRKCVIKKAISKMEVVSDKRDNEKKLASFSLRGDPIVRAYAATISLAMDGKIPYLATAKTPVGEVSYAMRGNADRDLLIGLQHYDHPQFRLMAFWKVAEKYGLHIYSCEENAVCCPDGPAAPEEYVDEIVELLPYDLDENFNCPHKGGEHLNIHWNSADVTINVCTSCLKDNNNTVHILASRIAAKDPADDFTVSIDRGIQCLSECEVCPIKEKTQLNPDLLAKYLHGQISDSALLDAYRIDWAKTLQSTGNELYIVNGLCFGSDKEKFLNALRGTEAEKETISKFISSGKRCIISRNDQIPNLLSDLWKDYDEELLSGIASQETVSTILNDRTDLAPSQMVAEAARLESYMKIKSRLPTFSNLGPMASFCDDIARIYKTEGKIAAVRALEKSKGSNHNLRSLTYGLLSAVGEGQSKAWQFTKEEMDFGTYLVPFAEKLLSAEGKEYTNALNLLLEASGAMEKVTVQQ